MSTTLDWTPFALSTDLLDATIAANGHGTWTIQFTGGGTGDNDIQNAGWSSKSLRLKTGFGSTLQNAQTVSFPLNSVLGEASVLARCGANDRNAITMHWDGLPAPSFVGSPNNGYIFQNRVATNELTITRWLNDAFLILATASFATPNKNDYTMKAVVKSDGSLDLLINGSSELTANDTNHGQGFQRFAAFALVDAFYDDMVFTQSVTPAAVLDSHGRRRR